MPRGNKRRPGLRLFGEARALQAEGTVAECVGKEEIGVLGAGEVGELGGGTERRLNAEEGAGWEGPLRPGL